MSTKKPPIEPRIWQTPIRMDKSVRDRVRAVCFHRDISKQAFLMQAVLRAIDEAEQDLGLTRKTRKEGR